MKPRTMILNSSAITHKTFSYVTKLSIKVYFPWEHGAHICKLFTVDFKFNFILLMDIFSNLTCLPSAPSPGGPGGPGGPGSP